MELFLSQEEEKSHGANRRNQRARSSKKNKNSTGTHVGAGTGATEPPRQRQRLAVDKSCDCTRHSTCQSTGRNDRPGCACLIAGPRHCISCACLKQCCNVSSISARGTKNSTSLQHYFSPPSLQGDDDDDAAQTPTTQPPSSQSICPQSCPHSNTNPQRGTVQDGTGATRPNLTEEEGTPEEVVGAGAPDARTHGGGRSDASSDDETDPPLEQVDDTRGEPN
jgi:hypothetical protein